VSPQGYRSRTSIKAVKVNHPSIRMDRLFARLMTLSIPPVGHTLAFGWLLGQASVSHSDCSRFQKLEGEADFPQSPQGSYVP
jgi:hypothetical protein